MTEEAEHQKNTLGANMRELAVAYDSLEQILNEYQRSIPAVADTQQLLAQIEELKAENQRLNHLYQEEKEAKKSQLLPALPAADQTTTESLEGLLKSQQQLYSALEREQEELLFEYGRMELENAHLRAEIGQLKGENSRLIALLQSRDAHV